MKVLTTLLLSWVVGVNALAYSTATFRILSKTNVPEVARKT